MDTPRKADDALPPEWPMNQQFHAHEVSRLAVLSSLHWPMGVLLTLPAENGFHFSTWQICDAAILGIVLATLSGVHRLAPTLAGGEFQGGRWTKDWCGGDQRWRLRLSGRGWTDRRRSG
jgi:hypothetical protein